MVKLSPLFENLSQEIAKMNLSVATVFSADMHKKESKSALLHALSSLLCNPIKAINIKSKLQRFGWYKIR